VLDTFANNNPSENLAQGYFLTRTANPAWLYMEKLDNTDENIKDSSETSGVDNPYASSGASYYALILLTIVYCFSFIDRQLLAILQESIKADLGLSDSQLGLLTGFAFALFYVTAGLPIARWADKSNRRNIVALAVFIWSFMTALSGAAQNYFQLLMARIGVGIGEAGGNPPSLSMISDIFPPHRRASVIGFYFTGVNIGIMFGFLLGGWLNEVFGWRIAFLVVGAPGIILALFVRYTLAEPARGLVENKQISTESKSSREVMTLLWSRRSFRHLVLAMGLNAFVLYSIASWTASFMIRSHGMTSGEVGTWLAMILGVGGAIGVFGGGIIADKLGFGDRRWYMWLPLLAGIISLPFGIYVYLAEGATTAMLCAIIPGVLGSVYLGPSMAAMHGLVGSRMRALATAIVSLISNLIGLGAGPFIIGLLSDLLAPSKGIESLRYSMLYVIPFIQVWAVCHFYMAAKSIRADTDAAPG